MLVRLAVGAILAIIIAACGGTPATSGPAGTTPAGSPGATAGASTSAPIDLSAVDLCTIIPVALAESLTGATGFKTEQHADVRSSSCFWAVPTPGVPQYLEVKVDRRTAPLGDYALTVNGVACPAAAVPGIGSEARGGVCTGDQTKVWLIALNQGVSVQVIVNEPKGTLTPADLVAAVNAVLAAL